MIAYLKGTLLQKRNQQVILLTQGVGYLVSVNSACLERLPEPGKDIEFFIENIGFKNPKHSTKWKIFKKYGYCLPRTTLKQRYEILKTKTFI